LGRCFQQKTYDIGVLKKLNFIKKNRLENITSNNINFVNKDWRKPTNIASRGFAYDSTGFLLPS